MGLFGKKKEKTNACGCEGKTPVSKERAEIQKTEGGSVKVLGSGCAKCSQLAAAVEEALRELDMETTVEHVTDFAQIAAYGVMSTPALVVDGKVVSYGKVLSAREAEELLRKG